MVRRRGLAPGVRGLLRRGAPPAALLGGSLGVALLLGEVLLRGLLPNPDGYYVYPPGLRSEFEPLEAIMPGVSGVSRFAVSSLGLRGDELAPEHTLRLLAVGGSTTQCLYLDQAEAWPQRLQVLLGERWGGGVWVGNAGKAGRRLPEHRVQLEHLLPAIGGLDAVVMLLGANDLNRRLSEGDDYRPPELGQPEAREALLARAFDLYPREYALLPLRRTALFALVERVQSSIRTRRQWEMIQDRSGRNYQQWRELRARARRIRDEPPDLGTALAAYAADLRGVQGLARSHGLRVVFLTQPSIYRDDLPPELAKLLWMGWVGERQSTANQEYYSVNALARAYQAFNGTLLGFCRETGAECLDLEPRLPKDTRSFYDDIHFNESGSEQVARTLFAYLVAQPPFGSREEAGSAP